MLSRVADSTYWMARNMERAENVARLLITNQNLALDSGDITGQDEEIWTPVFRSTGDEKVFSKFYHRVTGAHVEDFLSNLPENPNSIVNCVSSARENARMIRDQIPDELWGSINDLYFFVTGEKGTRLKVQSRTDYYEELVRASCQFQGVARATMMRNDGWHFLQIGTYLERADQTSRLVDMCSDLPVTSNLRAISHPLRWHSLLRSTSAENGYREQEFGINPRAILELLFLSRRFSRSVLFCINELYQSLENIETPVSSLKMSEPLRLCGALRGKLAYSSLDEILDFGLHEYIDELQMKLNQLGRALFEAYVIYANLGQPAPLPPTPMPQPDFWNISDHAMMQMQQQQQQ